MPFIDSLFRFGGGATYVLTGNRILTRDECAPKTLVFTGTLGAPATVRLDARDFDDWTLVNSTTQTLTFSGASGTTAAVESGGFAQVFYRVNSGLTFSTFDRASPGDIGATTPGIVTATELALASIGDTSVTRSVRHTYNPDYEGDIAGNPGDLLLVEDAGTGIVAVKGSGTGTTGWQRLALASEVFDPASPGPLGGTTASTVKTTELTVSTDTNAKIITSSGGDPNGSISAPMGSLCLETGDGALYVAGVGTSWGQLAWASDVINASTANYRALDANHVHVYRCSETSGATVTDTGSGARNLTLTGTEGTAYYRGTRRGARFAQGLALYADTNTRIAESAATASIAGEACTLEATVVASSQFGGAWGVVLCLDAGTGNYLIVGYSLATQIWRAEVAVSGVGLATPTTASTATLVRYGTKQHIMAVFDRSVNPCLSLYVDGVLAAVANASYVSAPTFTRVSIGNFPQDQTLAFRGAVYDARVSNIARSASYAITAAEAAHLL